MAELLCVGARIAGLVGVIIGVVFALVVPFFVQQSGAARTAQAPGQVVDGAPRPAVQFTTPAGKTIQFTSHTRYNPPRYSAGQSVPVCYDPNHPQDAEIEGVNSLILLVFRIIGGIAMLLGVIGLIRGNR